MPDTNVAAPMPAPLQAALADYADARTVEDRIAADLGAVRRELEATEFAGRGGVRAGEASGMDVAVAAARRASLPAAARLVEAADRAAKAGAMSLNGGDTDLVAAARAALAAPEPRAAELPPTPVVGPGARSGRPLRPPVPLWKTRLRWFLTGVVAWSTFGVAFSVVWGHANPAQVAENCRNFVRAYDAKTSALTAPVEGHR